jgi:excisionase family DNA binding protein
MEDPVAMKRDRRPTDRLAFNPVEAGEALGISRTQIYRLVKAGDLRARRCGSRILIPRKALEAYLDAS